MSTVYVLKLENNKYYVGKTDDLPKRILDHVEGRGSSWTQLHHFVELYWEFRSNSIFDEDLETLKMMNEFGIENVRGGTNSQPVLSESVVNYLRKQIAHANEACLRCFNSDHFAIDCEEEYNKYGDLIVDDEGFETESSVDDIPPSTIVNERRQVVVQPQQSTVGVRRTRQCTRCGRDSHWVDTCRAGTNIDGEYISDSDESYSDEDSYDNRAYYHRSYTRRRRF